MQQLQNEVLKKNQGTNIQSMMNAGGMLSMYQDNDMRLVSGNDYRSSANQTKVLTMQSETEINIDDQNLNIIRSNMSLKY